MTKIQEKDFDAQQLVKTIAEAIKEKQGVDLVKLDFTHIPNTVSSYFLICHTDSGVQMQSIAAFIERKVRSELGARPFSSEGLSNLEWVLLDYVDVVVHIFNEQTREFYNLEELWADAEITKLD